MLKPGYKRERLPGVPKRANSYFLWKEEFQDYDHDLTGRALAKELGKIWKTQISDVEKAMYKERAAEKNREFKDYRLSNPGSATSRIVKREKKIDSATGKTRRTSQRNAPVKVAFRAYRLRAEPRLRGQFPDATDAQLLNMVKETWKGFPATQEQLGSGEYDDTEYDDSDSEYESDYE
jgi:hypothetical protein